MLEQSTGMKGNVQVIVDGRSILVDLDKTNGGVVKAKSYYSKGGYSCSFRVPKVNGKGEMENQTIYFEAMGTAKVRDPNDPNNTHTFGQYHTTDAIEQAVLDHKIEFNGGNGIVMDAERFNEYITFLKMSVDSSEAMAVIKENNSLMAKVQELERKNKELQVQAGGSKQQR